MKVFDFIKVKETSAPGKIIMLIGYPVREVYADMYPGAQSLYEYITMWDEDEKKVCLRALNKYRVDEVEMIDESEIDLLLNTRSSKDIQGS